MLEKEIESLRKIAKDKIANDSTQKLDRKQQIKSDEKEEGSKVEEELNEGQKESVENNAVQGVKEGEGNDNQGVEDEKIQIEQLREDLQEKEKQI